MSLRNKVIRLAYQNPSLRNDLLPLLKTSASKTIIHEWLGDLLYRENPVKYGMGSGLYYIKYGDIYGHKDVELVFGTCAEKGTEIAVMGSTVSGKDFHLTLDISKETKSSASWKIIQFLKEPKS